MRMLIPALVGAALLSSSAMADQWHGGGGHDRGLHGGFGAHRLQGGFDNPHFFSGQGGYGYWSGFGAGSRGYGSRAYCQPWQGQPVLDAWGNVVACVLEGY